ncbi:hypothetical protein BH10PLA2_BH10PLA2_27930 [soil metagenome]
MTESFLISDPQAIAWLDSVACILERAQTMSSPDRKRFLGALIERSDEVQSVVVSLLPVVKDSRTTPAERKQASMTIADALSLNPGEMERHAVHESAPEVREGRGTNLLEETFAERLKELMATKQISQQELAERIGCSQPAISQLLSRVCRPQKRTILKLAEALSVHPSELWPDIDLADMLDAVASFQQDDYTMTAAETSALVETVNKNRAKIRVKLLPTHPDSQRE